MNRTTLAAVAISATLALTSCGLPGLSSGSKLASTPATTSETPSPSPSPSPTYSSPWVDPTTTPTPSGDSGGIEQFKVGDTATVTEDGEKAMEITVEKVEYSTRPRSGYGDPAKYRFAFITIKYTALADGQDYNELDWSLQDNDGNTYDFLSGHGFGAVGDGQLNSGTLRKGQKKRGVLAIDAPSTANQLTFSPHESALGIWTMPST